ncbi:MAG: PIN domain-containing protein [Verrucomicrobiales bacterium]|nr:PIN domain-containing protein [Verrucomicrobiales bacterium]
MNGGAVFLDASVWIALRDPREPRHAEAQRVVAQVLRGRSGFVVTPLIFAETHAYFTRSRLRRTQVLDDFEKNPVIRCEPTLASDHAEAIRLLRDYTDKAWSFCDAVSLVVMRRLGLRRAASFDQHFRQFGELEIIE